MAENDYGLTVSVIPQKITYDLSSVKESVKAITEMYADWIVKEEDLKTAKDTIAALNKMSKTLSDQRIAVAKDFKKPLDEFENEIKDLCKLIDNSSKAIKIQYDEFELATRESTRKYIMSLPNYADYIVFDERWLNKTTKIESVIADINEQVNTFNISEITVKNMAKALGLNHERYVSMLKGGVSIAEISARISSDNEIKNEVVNKVEPIIIPHNEKIFSNTYIATGNSTQIDLLESYAKKIGIELNQIG